MLACLPFVSPTEKQFPLDRIACDTHVRRVNFGRRNVERYQNGSLDNKGVLLRLSVYDGPEVPQECEKSGSGAGTSSGGSADVASVGRVHLPAPKHPGNQHLSMSYDGAAGISGSADTRPKGGKFDGYARRRSYC